MMFRRRITLFKLLGFAVRIDASWLFLAGLISWSLAQGFFPHRYPGLDTAVYWVMSISAALGLFASIIFHELSHSLVARYYGLHMSGITLFIFGGVAEMTEEPPSPKVEFLMAAVGPLFSVVFGVGCGYVAGVGQSMGWPLPCVAVLSYLMFINVLLAGFNTVPAFPLDGGRVLRSALWHWRGDLQWATRVASRIGSGFGLTLIVLGAVRMLFGHVIGGMWWCLIGSFLRKASQRSYQQAVLRQTIERQPVRPIVVSDAVMVPASMTIQQLIDDHIQRYHVGLFPVVDHGRVVGCITAQQAEACARDERSWRTLAEVMSPCSPDNSIASDAGAAQALSAMRRSGLQHLMVVDDGHLIGTVSGHDLLKLLHNKTANATI